MSKIVLGAAALACAALWSTEAAAEVGTAPFNPSTDFRAEEFPWESGFIPSTGPISVNLTATPYQDVSILMFGDGDYDFDASRIMFTGEADSGVFTNTLGAEITVIIALDVLGIVGEFELGLYSIEEDAIANFTPYVLPGADPRPIEVSEDIAEANLVNEDFTFPIGSVPGNINIDFHIEIPGISYQSTNIDITDEPDSAVANELAVYDVENENLDLVLPNAAPGDTAEIYGELNGQFSSEVAIVFDITVSVTVFEQDFSVGPFEIRLDYPLQTDSPVVFEPELMQYTVPAEPPAGTSGDPTTGDPTDSDSDSDSDSATTGDPTGDGGSSSGGEPPADTDGVPADNVGGDDDGCGCTSGQPASGWTVGLAMLGLFAFRRRRA